MIIEIPDGPWQTDYEWAGEIRKPLLGEYFLRGGYSFYATIDCNDIFPILKPKFKVSELLEGSGFRLVCNSNSWFLFHPKTIEYHSLEIDGEINNLGKLFGFTSLPNKM